MFQLSRIQNYIEQKCLTIRCETSSPFVEVSIRELLEGIVEPNHSDSSRLEQNLGQPNREKDNIMELLQATLLSQTAHLQSHSQTTIQVNQQVGQQVDQQTSQQVDQQAKQQVGQQVDQQAKNIGQQADNDEGRKLGLFSNKINIVASVLGILGVGVTLFLSFFPFENKTQTHENQQTIQQAKPEELDIKPLELKKEKPETSPLSKTEEKKLQPAPDLKDQT